MNISKPILSYTNIKKIRNELFYSIENCFRSQNIYKRNIIEEIEEDKNKKKGYIKLLGQKINVIIMKIEILQNFKKNKNFNQIYLILDIKKYKR